MPKGSGVHGGCLPLHQGTNGGAEEMSNRVRWWWVGLFDRRIRLMNIAYTLGEKDMRELGEWMVAEADNRTKPTGRGGDG